MMKRLYGFLSTSYGSWFCIITALLARTVQVIFVSFIGRDKVMQLVMARNFIEGNGFTITKYFTQDPDQPYFDATPMWPPGYSFILSILIRLVQYNYNLAVILFESIAAILFVWSFRRICKQLSFPLVAVNLMTLLAGGFHYICFIESYVTDGAALAFLLFAFSGCLSLLQKPEEFSVSRCLAIAITLSIPAFLRYMYVPVVIILPFYLISTSLANKHRQLLKKSLVVGATTIILVFSMMLWIKFSSGSMGYIKETGRGIFLQNFLSWHPAFISSFVNTNFVALQLNRLTHVPVSKFMRLFEALSIILTLILIAFIYFRARKEFKTLRKPDTIIHFFKAGLLLCVAIYFVLIVLTLTNRPQVLATGNWNYIFGARYYAFVHVFLQLSFIGWLVYSNEWKKHLVYRLIAGLLVFLLTAESLHGYYYSAKVAINFRSLKRQRTQEHDYTYFNGLVNQLHQQYPGKKIIAASTDEYFMGMAVLLGERGIYDPYELNTHAPHVKENCILIVAIPRNQMNNFQDFLSTPAVQYLSTQADVNFYLKHLSPSH